MTSGPKVDLHVHSAHSPDGGATVDELIAAAVRRGLGGLALTDHNSVAGLGRLEALRRERPGLLLLGGTEVSAAEGHLLVYGAREVPPPRRPIAETIDWCVARGAVPVLAHPLRWTHGAGAAVARTARLVALETVNGHNGARANRRAAAIAAARGLATTGGSDAHGAAEVGTAWTRFPETAATADDLLRELGRGRTVAEGRGASALGRCRTALRSAGLRARRGLRAI